MAQRQSRQRRIRALSDSGRSRPLRSRALRVSAERVFGLARHLTERDREIALALYQHQLLTTDQLTLLFFSSRRRAQDRLRFLYEQRVLDRFYPPRPYGLGKAQAHWLLDEGGAILVAASLEVERKELRWRRRDDWRSYPQLLHRLEANRFVTDLIGASLGVESTGLSEWWSSRRSAARLSDAGSYSRPIPDTGFYLETGRGRIECYLEWDRGTETLVRLREKLNLYRRAERRAPAERDCVNVLFVVPTERRLRVLAEALATDDLRRKSDGGGSFGPRWSYVAALHAALVASGPLAPVWRLLTEPSRVSALSDLPARTDLPRFDLSRCLGREWRKERPDFWQALSPLGVPSAPARTVAADEERVAATLIASAPVELGAIDRMREQLLVEARADIEVTAGPPETHDE
jgi:Replication-relaxation